MARSTDIYNHLMLLKSRPGWASLSPDKQIETEEKYKNLHAQALAEERGLVEPAPVPDPFKLQLKQDPVSAPAPRPALNFRELADKLSSTPSREFVQAQVTEPKPVAPVVEPLPAWNEHPIDFGLGLVGEGYRSLRRAPAKAGSTMLQMGGYLANLTGANETAKDMYTASTATDEQARVDYPSAIKPIEAWSGEGGLVDIVSSPVQKLLPFMISSGGEMLGTTLPTMGAGYFSGKVLGQAMARLAGPEKALAKSAFEKLAKSLALSGEELAVMDKIRQGTQAAATAGGLAASSAMEGGSIMSDFQNKTGQTPTTADAWKIAPMAGLLGGAEYLFGGESGAVRAALDKGAQQAGKAVTTEALQELERPLLKKVVTNVGGEMATEFGQTGGEELGKEYLKTKDLAKALENTANLDTLAKMTGSALAATVSPVVTAGIEHHNDVKTAQNLRNTLGGGPGYSLLQTINDPQTSDEEKAKLYQKFAALPADEQKRANDEFTAKKLGSALGKTLPVSEPAAPVEKTPTSEPVIEPPAAPVETTPVEPAPASEPVPSAPAVNMQNRDRSRASSVEQMESIAENPDYGRLSVSRSVDVGAPLVSVKDNARTLPETDLGGQDTATFADGTKLPFRYGVVEADQVTPSHNARGEANPAYQTPQPGNMVALTNGRVAGLQEAHLRRNADEYVKSLLADPAHGVPLESISSKKKPMLVRLYDDTANAGLMGRVSNQRYGMELSPSEQAQDDAKTLTPLLQNLEFEDDGRLKNSGKNKEAFLAHLSKVVPQSELNRVVTKDGSSLTDAGLSRIENAAVAMAYKSPTLVESMTENRSDSNVKTVMNGLVRAAPDTAQLNLEIERGNVFPVSLAPDLALAAEKLSRLRSEKAVKDYLSQGLMESDGSSPVSRMLMGFFAQTRSARAVGELVKKFNDIIRDVGSPRQLSLVEDNPPPTVAGVLEKAIQIQFPEFVPEMAKYKAGPTVLMSRARSKNAVGSQETFDSWLANLETKNPQAAAGIRDRIGRGSGIRDIANPQNEKENSVVEQFRNGPAGSMLTQSGVKAKETPGFVNWAPFMVMGKKIRNAAIDLAIAAKKAGDTREYIYVGWDVKGQKIINDILHEGNENEADQVSLAGMASIINEEMSKITDDSVTSKSGGDDWDQVIRLKEGISEADFKAVLENIKKRAADHIREIAAKKGIDIDTVANPRAPETDFERELLLDLEAAGKPIEKYLERYKKRFISYLTNRGAGIRFGWDFLLADTADKDLHEEIGKQHKADKEGGASDEFYGPHERRWFGPSDRSPDSGTLEEQRYRRTDSEEPSGGLRQNERESGGTQNPEGTSGKEVTQAESEPSVTPVQEVPGALPSPEKPKPAPTDEELADALRKAQGLPPVEKKAPSKKQGFKAVNVNGAWVVKDPAGNTVPGFFTTSELAAKLKADLLNDEAQGKTPEPETAPSPAAPAPEPEPVKTGIQDFGEKIGGARKDLETPGTKKTGPKAEDNRPTWAKRYEVSEIASSLDQSEKGKFVIFDSRTKEAVRDPENRWKDRLFQTREEAEAAIPLVALVRNHRVVSSRDGTYEIVRDVTDRKRVVLKSGFATREEAMKYMVLHAVELLETKTAFGEEILLAPEKAMRQGAERRKSDATPEMFGQTFGFRGVEFGNWNNQAERQEVMNHAFDGLLDLAEVLNIPAKAISLNGELALAFGARGQGLSGARAHYERDYGVINLTKMKGAGSLAHEWFHALDHYLGRQDIKSEGKMTPNERGDKTFQGKDMRMLTEGFWHDSGLRAELKESLKNVFHTLNYKAEKYVEDTEKAEKWVGVARNALRAELNRIRDSLAKEAQYGRKTKPATVEQLARFDTLADRLVNGEDLETRVISNEKSQTFGKNFRWSNDTLEAMNEILKEVRGRSGFNSERSGLLNNVAGTLTNYRSRVKMMEDAASKSEKTRNIPTEFRRNATSIDQGRASDYWSDPVEMAARAFSAYVEDKISERGGASDFLSFGSNNNQPFFRLLGLRPFPEGEERLAINRAFDNLVQIMQTRETPKGVAIYSKENDHVSQKPQRADDSVSGTPERTGSSGTETETGTGAPAMDRGDSGRNRERSGLPVSTPAGRTLRTLEEVIAREEQDQGFIGAFREVTDLDTSQMVVRDAFQTLFGKDVVFFEDQSPDAKAHGGESMLNGVIVHELFPDTIFINAKSKKVGVAIAGHELLHMIQKDSPQLYQRLTGLLEKEIQNFPEFLKRLNRRGDNTQNLPSAQSELYGDFLGDQLLRPEFWSRLVQKNPTVFEKVVEVFNRFLSMVRSFFRGRGYDSEVFFKDLAAAREAMADAVAEYAKERQGRNSLARAVASIGTKPVTTRNALAEGLAKMGRNFPNRPSEELAFDDFEKWSQEQKTFKADMKSWSEQAPDTLQFGDESRMVVVSKNTRSGEAPWRMTWFHNRNGEWFPTGHLAFNTKADAVEDASHYGNYRPDIRFSYAGERAERLEGVNTWENAKARLDRGEDPETVRKETGWFVGKYDGRPRFEIDDSGMTVRRGWTNKAMLPYEWDGGALLPEVIHHPALFAAYPQLREVRVQLGTLAGPKMGAFFNVGTNTIYLGRDFETVRMNSPEMKETLLHEIQHGIQKIEGFASGASPEAMKASYPEEFAASMEKARGNEYLPGEESDLEAFVARDIYRHHAGEIESRDVEARSEFSNATRRETRPFSSENILPEDAFVVPGSKSSDSADVLFSRADREEQSAVAELQSMVDKKQAPVGLNSEESKTFLEQAQQFIGHGIGNLASELAMEEPSYLHAQSRDAEVKTAEEMQREMKLKTSTMGSDFEDKVLAAHIRADNSQVIAALTKWTPPGPLQDWLLKKVRRVLAPLHAADQIQRLLFNIAERVYWDGEKMTPSPGFRQKDDNGRWVYQEDGIPNEVAFKAFQQLSPEWQKVLTDRAIENEKFRQDFINKWIPKVRAETGLALMGKILRDLQTITDKAERADLFRLWEGDPNARDELRKKGVVTATQELLDLLTARVAGDETAVAILERLKEKFSTLKSRFNMDNSHFIGYLDREIEKSNMAWRRLLWQLNNLKENQGHFGYVHHTGYDNPGINDPGSAFDAANIFRHPWFEEVPGTLKGREGNAGFQENLIMSDIAKGRKTIRADARNAWMKYAEDNYGLTFESVTDPENPDRPPQLPDGYDIKSKVIANFGKYTGRKIFLPTKMYEQYRLAVEKGTIDPEVKEVSEALGVVNDAVSMVNEAMLWHPAKAMRDLFSAPFHLMEFWSDWSFKNPDDAVELPGLILGALRKSMTASEWQRQSPESKGEYSESLYFFQRETPHWITRAFDLLSDKYKPGTTIGALFRQINLAGAADLPIKRAMTIIGETLADKRKLTGIDRERFVRRVVNEYAYETSDLPPLLKWARGLNPTKDSKIAGVAFRSLMPFFGYAFRLAHQMTIRPFLRGYVPLGKALAGGTATRENWAEALRPLKWIALAALVRGGAGGLLPPEEEEVAGGLQNRPGLDPKVRTASRQLIYKDDNPEGGEYYLSLKGLGHYAVGDSILQVLKRKQGHRDFFTEFVSVHPAADTFLNILGFESPYGGVPLEAKLGRLTAMFLAPQFTRLGPDVAKIIRSMDRDETVSDEQKKTFLQAFVSQLGFPAGPIKTDGKGNIVTTKKWIENVKLAGINVRYIPFVLSEKEVEREAVGFPELAKKLMEMDNPNRPWEKKKNSDGTPMTEAQYLISRGLMGRGRTIEDAREQLRQELKTRAEGFSKSAGQLKKLGFDLKTWDPAKTQKLLERIFPK